VLSATSYLSGQTGCTPNALQDQTRLEEAILAYQRAVELKPDYLEAWGQLLHQRQHACEWNSFDADQQRLLEIARRSDGAVAPFIFLASPATAADQLHAARKWAAGFKSKNQKGSEIPHFDALATRPICLGYLSADFHQHATNYLMTELFERHDRSRFKVIGFSYGPDDKSAMRARVSRAFDRFVDIRSHSHAEAASSIRENRVDILIDLKGYTTHSRTEILACRPAPIQINYLGYPGTMGAEFIDYIIADRFVVPDDQQTFYSECLAYLPHCYQPNDTKRSISEHIPSRMACGLPEQGFVLCCFNNSYKITPTMFGVWMRLLTAVPGSVLWLLDANALARTNLRREAALRGVGPERLVFAPRMPLDEHLARHHHAELVLDTLPCNAHTTASDALWAGVPILTCAGSTFAGRVAGSLLRAVGLPELITTSLDEYETLATKLACEPMRLLSLRQKLNRHRQKAPLFNIAQFTNDIEAAYWSMWENYCFKQANSP
jgi:predicted O-linked N-acetylglucosamine transferase (SPINDLY family)